MTHSTDAAVALAARVLILMADEPEDMAGFLGTSGLDPADLRLVAQRPEISEAILDFVAESDERMMRVSQALAIPAREIMAARTALSGPGTYGWSVD